MKALPPTIPQRPTTSARRAGKVLVLFVVLLPTMLATIAYFVDGSMMLLESRKSQHVSDAAATAAALEMWISESDPDMTAEAMVVERNHRPNATVATNVPPASGPFFGRDGFVEVTVEEPYVGTFLPSVGWNDPVTLRTRSVAGVEAATAPAAIVVLDPDPPPIELAALPITLPSVNPLLGGLEVLGLGELLVHGAVLVNNAWGGVDETGAEVGERRFLRAACSCMPLLPLSRVRADDVRVVGGVDNADRYQARVDDAHSPLRANRRPVPDPFASLPVPTVTSDSANVNATQYGGVSVLTLPLLQPPRVLRPGVYDWIEIVAGRVIFEPGVYIIRGTNPLTGISLSLLTGKVTAEGVMFYLTNSSSYSPSSGLPDSLDGEVTPGSPSLRTLLPSALIDVGLLNSRFTPLDDPQSPFHGMSLYQRRHDRRPIVFVQQGLIGNAQFSGNVYAKWAPVMLSAQGTFRSAFVVGSLRVVTVLRVTVNPLVALPPAYDVFLVE